MDKDEVFLDAQEEVTPRRTTRKRRSTAGSTTSCKKPRPGKKMPVERSPGGRRGNDCPPLPQGAPAPQDADPDAFWAKMGGMLGGMEARMKKETEEVKERLGQAIGELGTRVEKTERRLDGFAEEVHSIVDSRVARALEQITAASTAGKKGQPEGQSYASVVASVDQSGGGGTRKARSPAKREEEVYWECRRALRLRPVEEGNDIGAVTNFMTDHLRLDSKTMDIIGSFSVQRIPQGPASKIKNEVLVIYRSVEARDVVKGAARNLAGLGQEYGVRLEIPNRLKTNMKALQSVSYDLKQKYPTARRNVLMDDDHLDLALDFCLAEGQPWKRMTASQARARKKKGGNATGRLQVEDDEIDRLLNDAVEDTP